jgi:hypothetical protein
MNEQHLDAVLDFIAANGHVPRGQRKAAGVQHPPEKRELKLGAIVTRIRSAVKADMPHAGVGGDSEVVLDKIKLILEAPNKQQHSAKQAHFEAIFEWAQLAAHLGCPPPSTAARVERLWPGRFDEGAAARIVRVSKLISDRKCGQFYADLLEPAMWYAAETWDNARTPEDYPRHEFALRESVLAFLRDHLQDGIDTQVGRADARRVSKIQRKNRARLDDEHGIF